MNRIDLDGRAAAVTGAAQGIGYAIAERLIRSGAAVALWDRDATQLEAAKEALGAPASARGFVVDVTRLDEVERAVTATVAWAGLTGHSGLQCRHNRADRTGLGVSGGRVAACARRRSDRRVPLHARGRAVDDRAQLRPHLLDRVDRRQGGKPQCQRVQRGQGRCHRVDQVAGQGTRQPRHCRELRDTGRCAYEHLPADESRVTSTTCCRRFHAAGSSRSRRSRPWWRGWCRARTRSPPAPSLTSAVVGRPTEAGSR